MATPHLSLLTEEDLGYLLEQVLTVLAEIGAWFGSAKARAVLENGGCDVDHETMRVRIPRDVCLHAIGLLERDVLLAARDPDNDAPLGGSRTFVTAAGITPWVVDMQTGARREPTLDDLARETRLLDALDQIGIVWCSMSPTASAPGRTTDLAALACLLAGTSKHIMGQLVRPEDVPLALEMLNLAAPAGDLLERPIFSSIYCPVAPLQHEADASEAAMEMAKAHIPVDVFSETLAGATSPVTLAGTVIQTVCDELSGTVLLKLVDPTCPLILSSNSGLMDMRTSRFVTCSPETVLMGIAEVELVHSLGAPSLAVGHVSNSWGQGFRAGLDDMYAVLIRLARPDIMIGAGCVEGGQGSSLVKLVIDAEVAADNDRFLEGIAIDDEHSGVSSLRRVGPGGSFLGLDETRSYAHSGEYWLPDVLRRSTYDEFETGAPDELAHARARVEDVLASHTPLPLPDGAEEGIARIMERVRARE